MVWINEIRYTTISSKTYMLSGYAMPHVGPDTRTLIRQAFAANRPDLAQEFVERAWIQNVVTLCGGVYHRDCNAGNFLMDPLTGNLTVYDLEADSGVVQLSKESIASLWRQFKKRWIVEPGFGKLNFEFDPIVTLEKQYPKGWYDGLPDKPLLRRAGGGLVEEAVTSATMIEGKIVTINPATVDSAATGLKPLEIVTLQSKGRLDRFVVWAKNVGGKIFLATGIAMIAIDVSNMVTDVGNPLGQGFVIVNGNVGQPVSFDGGAKFDKQGELSGIWNELYALKYSDAIAESERRLSLRPHDPDPRVKQMAHDIATSQIWHPRAVMIRDQRLDQKSTPDTFFDVLAADGPTGERVIVIIQLLDISAGANLPQKMPIVAGYFSTHDQGKTWQFVRLVPIITFKKGVLNGEKLMGGQDMEFEVAGTSILNNTAYMKIVRTK